MAKQTFKCDYCSYTDTKKDIVSKHEGECTLNPLVKACLTCKFKIWGDYAMSMEITGCKRNIPDCDKIGDMKNCEIWKSDEIATNTKG